MRIMGSFVLSFLLLFIAGFGRRAFSFQSPTFCRRRTSSASLFGALDQQPHESDSAYMKRLMEVASDASSFEKAVMSGDSYQYETTSTESNAYQRVNDNDTTPKKKKGTYQRGEVWDAERQANGTMTWEEKVQWDGQRNGNRVNQNDILRHHLNTF